METYLTIADVAKYLKFSKETIQRWVGNKEIPFCKIKRQIRFRVSDLEKWIEGNEVIDADNNSDCNT